MALSGKRILLVIGGGIAAYKSLDLIRRLRERGAVGALHPDRRARSNSSRRSRPPRSSGQRAHTDLFDREDEADIGHIRLARDADADRRRAGDRQPDGEDGGRARRRSRLDGAARDDAADPDRARHERPHVAAPGDAAQPRDAAATTASPSSARTTARWRRPSSAPAAWRSRSRSSAAVERLLGARAGPLAGKRVLVTSGPTHEPIDPVRYIANRSSGKQGHAIARAAAAAGAAGDARLRPGRPARPARRRDGACRERARDAGRGRERAAGRYRGVRRRRRRLAGHRGRGAQKIKKNGRRLPALALAENPDILATVARRQSGPSAARRRLCGRDREGDRARARRNSRGRAAT